MTGHPFISKHKLCRTGDSFGGRERSCNEPRSNSHTEAKHLKRVKFHISFHSNNSVCLYVISIIPIIQPISIQLFHSISFFLRLNGLWFDIKTLLFAHAIGALRRLGATWQGQLCPQCRSSVQRRSWYKVGPSQLPSGNLT